MAPDYHFYPLKRSLEITELISLFYFKSPRDYRFDGESHDFWEFIFVDQGRVLITAGKNRYVLRAGELAFHKPGEFHAVCAYENTPACFIIAAFVCTAPCMRHFEHRIQTLTSREREYLYEAVRRRRNAVFTEEAAASGRPGDAQIMQANLEMLLLALLDRGESAQIQTRVESYVQQTRYRQLSDKVKGYLQAHIGEALTLEDIGNALGYSVSQMKKLFRQENGRGVIDYFITLKMDEAKRLIREGELTLSEIAARLGYENPGYFSRLFRQREAMTPSEYGRSARSPKHKTAAARI